MSYICGILYGISAFFVIRGFYRGMMKMVITVAGIVLTLFLVSTLAPEWEIVMNENVFIYENVENAVEACALTLPPEVQEEAEQSGTVTKFIIKVIAYLSMYVLISVVVKVSTWLILKVVELPGLHFLNSVAGAVLGTMQSLMVLWSIFLAVTLCYGHAWGYEIYGAIREDTFMRFLYDNNLFFYFLKS